ncbi:MAG: HRDC domain-containing protein [Solirubrobacteraceae bacterium]|nr:HRDC domain-containing protein [Solirubrobacteraceae bacterium]
MSAPSASLAELAELAGRSGELAIDTEFVGEGRYRPLLCLVQVAVANGPGAPSIALHDPLAHDAEDPGPLARALADPAVGVVLHAGRQDVALLRRCWQTEVRGVFDTQVAAGFAGLRAQLGYEALLQELLGERLRKSASFTRWDRRPLSDEQVGYAREDVLHLLDAAAALRERLSGLGRLAWAQEECRGLEESSDERSIDLVFGRLPRVNSLGGEQRAVAHALAQWREDAAAQEDRPVQQVLSDAGLVEIAKRRPRDLDRLRQIRGLHEGTVRRRGNAILDEVARGLALPPIPVDGERPPPTHAGDAALIVLAEALVRTRADEARLAYELLAARADLQRIVTAVRLRHDEPDVRTLRGWRRELVGAELLELLAGRRALSVDEQLGIAVDER